MHIESISRNVNMNEGVHAALKCQKEITAEIKIHENRNGQPGNKRSRRSLCATNSKGWTRPNPPQWTMCFTPKLGEYAYRTWEDEVRQQARKVTNGPAPGKKNG